MSSVQRGSSSSFMKGGGSTLLGGAPSSVSAKVVGRRRAASFVVNDATNVRVFVRVRPFLPRELGQGIERPVVTIDGKDVQVLDAETFLPRNEAAFHFDNCFWSIKNSNSNIKFWSQQEIYEEVGSIILDNVFQGYNACLFAYGQTGSGKTYTMMGSIHNPPEWGIIPRLCSGLFERLATERLNSGREYRVEVGYIEIYNEQLRDLINPKKDPHEIRVRDDPKYGPYVEGNTLAVCANYEDIQKQLFKGDRYRHTAATNMNDQSSRSHAVLTVIFSQFKVENDANGQTVQRSWISKLNLIDLAGSERVLLSGVEGINFEEAKNINLSLSTLGKVIDALVQLSEGKKGIRPPYRDSLLTRVLQDSLGGNSKTMMFANISPSPMNTEETLSTLRYASRARAIKNQARINTDSQTAIIDGLNAELEALRRQLSDAQHTQRGPSPEQLEEIENLQAQLSQNQDLIARLKAQSSQLSNAHELATQKQQEVEEMQVQRLRLESELSDLKKTAGERDRLARDVNEKDAETRRLRDQIEEMRRQNEEAKRKCEAEKAEKDRQIRSLQGSSDENQKRSRQLESEMQDKDRQLRQLDGELKDKEQKHNMMIDEIEDKKKRLQDFESQVTSHKRRSEDLDGRLEEMVRENADLKMAVKKWKTKYEEGQDELERERSRKDENNQETLTLKKQLERLKLEMKQCNERWEAERRRSTEYLSALAGLEEQVVKINAREVHIAERTLSPQRNKERQNGINKTIEDQRELIKTLQQDRKSREEGLFESIRELDDAVRTKEYDRMRDAVFRLRRASGSGSFGSRADSDSI